MKKAIMALDGGGSNLRMLIVDADTDTELYFKTISTVGIHPYRCIHDYLLLNPFDAS